MDLTVDGKTTPRPGPGGAAPARSIAKTLHVDLHEVAADELVEITVPVETKSGRLAGVRVDGGLLEHVLFKVRVRALPADLPECIEIDVTDMQTGRDRSHRRHRPPLRASSFWAIRNIPVASVAKSRVGQVRG